MSETDDDQGEVERERGFGRREMLGFSAASIALAFAAASFVRAPGAFAANGWTHPFATRAWYNGDNYFGRIRPDVYETPPHMHRGSDFVNNPDPIVRAAKPGVVVHAGSESWAGGELGQVVVIQHTGYWSLYAHLQTGSITVSTSDSVVNGTPLGLMGATGTSSGAHLHIEIGVGSWNSSRPIADLLDPYDVVGEADLPGAPTNQGEEVPGFIDLDYATAQSFPTADWGWARPSVDNLSIASGGLVMVTANVQISGLGSNIAKFRFVRYNADTTNVQALEPLFIQGAGSTTYGQISAVTSLGADTRLRLQMKADVSGISLANIAVRGLRWAP